MHRLQTKEADAKRKQKNRTESKAKESEDPAHVQHIRAMRDVNSEQPVSDKLIRSLNLLTKEAVHKHGNTLRFASIAVLSQRERHPLNLCQARLFARTYNKPLFKWKLPLSGPAASWITKEEEGLIYKHEEAGVYGYFVEGAPCVVLRNLLTNRTLVNGCNGTMYSLSLHHEEDADDSDEDEYATTLAEYVEEAKLHYQRTTESVLEVVIPMPFSINVCPDISKHHSDFLLGRNISMLPGTC